MRFGGRPLSRKLDIFEYITVIIGQIDQAKHTGKIYHNYNHLAEASTSQYKISRKEKETVIELLEHYYPPVKHDLGALGKQRLNVTKSKTTLNSNLPKRAPSSKKSSSRLQQADSNRINLTTSLHELVKSSIKRILGLRQINKAYESDPNKFKHAFIACNGLTARLGPNQSKANIESMLGDASDFILIPKSTKEEYEVIFRFAPLCIQLVNVRADDALLYFSFSNYTSYSSIQVMYW